ncbi:MAG: hypothetical protein K2N38_02860 [Oscillospiraceae bacterium]|nr:hypothetical protein [Oscillospiraceae bacterium]
MITSTAFDPSINYDPAINYKPSAVSSDFGELMSQKSTTNYDRLTEWVSGLWHKTAVNVIDASKVNGLHRKDFPQALLFEENMTLEELNSYAPTYPEPKDTLDPRALKNGRAACKKNGIAVLISPEAVERMNNDEDFFNKIMAQLEEKIVPSVRESMAGLPRVTTKGDFEYTSTDCSIIVEIDGDGNVAGEVISCGSCTRISDDEEEPESEDFVSKAEMSEDVKHIGSLHLSRSEKSLPDIFNEQQEYLYSFLGSFNSAASQRLVEYRKRK